MKTQNAPAAVSADDRLAEMERDIKKIKRRLLILAIGSYVRLLILLIPLVLAVWFLPPFIREVWSQYGTLLQVDTILKQLNQ